MRSVFIQFLFISTFAVLTLPTGYSLDLETSGIQYDYYVGIQELELHTHFEGLLRGRDEVRIGLSTVVLKNSVLEPGKLIQTEENRSSLLLVSDPESPDDGFYVPRLGVLYSATSPLRIAKLPIPPNIDHENIKLGLRFWALEQDELKNCDPILGFDSGQCPNDIFLYDTMRSFESQLNGREGELFGDRDGELVFVPASNDFTRVNFENNSTLRVGKTETWTDYQGIPGHPSYRTTKHYVAPLGWTQYWESQGLSNPEELEETVVEVSSEDISFPVTIYRIPRVKE